MNLYDCLTNADDFDWGGLVDTATGPYYHHQNGCKVLGVAHLDTVLQAKPVKSGQMVFAPQLDDRLGVWCLLSLLPAMGINLDVLLTTGEEKCRSTASEFQGGDYNWVIEFDRAGTDVVFYHYDYEKHWTKKWKSFTTGRGSYSDIADLDLGVCCANIGIGYHNQHSYSCYADLTDTKAQMLRFCDFYNKNKDTVFPVTAMDDWDHSDEDNKLLDKWGFKIKKSKRSRKSDWNAYAYAKGRSGSSHRTEGLQVDRGTCFGPDGYDGYEDDERNMSF